MYHTAVTICTAQWSLFVPHSGHYMYHTAFTTCTAQWSIYVPHSVHYMYRTVVTICTTQWSLYVPHSVHYMYRTVVTICTTQWSLYVPHSGHYMYHTAVTICTAQWSLYVPHSGHYMYRTVVTICATRFNTHKLYVLPTQCIYVFCVDLRTNSDCFHNLHRVRSLRGTDRILISSPSSSSCSRRVRCFSCSLILKMHWSLHLFLGRPIFLRPFGLYCSACFGSLFVSIHCTCCRHFFWYCFISFTMFSAPIFLIR